MSKQQTNNKSAQSTISQLSKSEYRRLYNCGLRATSNLLGALFLAPKKVFKTPRKSSEANSQ